MTDKTLIRLGKLSRIADLVKDAALGDLARASQACSETRQRLQALEPSPPAETSLPLGALENAALLHERWAEPRRRRLLEELALQTARRLDCEAVARRALGRADVVHKLYRRQALRQG